MRFVDKNTETILAVGVLAIAAYAAYKLVKPTAETATYAATATGKALIPTGQAIGQVSTSAGNLASDVLNAPKNYWNYVTGIGESAGQAVRSWLSRWLS